MKLIIVLIFTFIYLTSAINIKRQTLTQWYYEVIGNASTPFNNFKFNINEACITSMIQSLSQFPERNVNFIEAIIVIYGAGIGCTYPNICFVYKNLLTDFIKFYQESTKIQDTECFKRELWRTVYPGSYYPSHITLYGLSCASVIDDVGFRQHIQHMEMEYGSFQDLTCGAFSSDDFRLFLLNIIALAGSSNYRFIDQQIYDLSTCLHERLNAALYCITSRFINSYGGHPTIANKNCLIQIGSKSVKDPIIYQIKIEDHCVVKQIYNPFYEWSSKLQISTYQNMINMNNVNNLNMANMMKNMQTNMMHMTGGFYG